MLAYDPATNPLNTNEWAFPLTECVHIGSMALSVGTIALIDLRMLGFGLRKQTPAQLVNDTELWTLCGFVLVIISGLMIFSSDPVHYLHNGPFQFKMAVLLLGILYNYTLHRKAARLASPGATGAIAACGSLLLWISLAVAGIFIAFV